LTDINLIRDFYTKDNEVTTRVLPFDYKISNSLLLMGGDKGLGQRRVFSDFFRMDNVQLLLPLVRKSISDHFLPSDRENTTGLDFSGRIDDTLMHISNTLMFEEGRPAPTASNGKAFCQEIIRLFGLLYSNEVLMNPLNALTFDWLNKLNIFAKSKEAASISKDFRIRISEYIHMREKELRDMMDKGGEKISDLNKIGIHKNIMDTMIANNILLNEDEKMTFDELIGNAILFFVTSYDTTVTSTRSVLFCLAHRQDLQQKLYDEIKSKNLDKPDIKIEQLDSSELLTNVVNEGLRLYTPGTNSFERIITKDFSAGGYSFRKGDQIIVPYGPLMWDDKHFSKPREFNLSNITPENKKYYLPFSTGKRACVGRVSADMEMKLFVILTLSKYRLIPMNTEDECRYVNKMAGQIINCGFTLQER